MQAIGKENTMGQFIPKMPLYIWEGTADELMPLADTDALAAKYCAGGAKLNYQIVSGGDHITAALKLSNGLSFLVDRFNGKTAPSNCK